MFVPKVVMKIVFGELREAPVLEIGFSIHKSERPLQPLHQEGDQAISHIPTNDEPHQQEIP